MIQIQNGNLFYSSGKAGFFRRPTRNEILQEINLELKPSSIHFVTGNSGAGKSALLRILACEELDWSGEFFWKGEKIKGKKAIQNCKKQIGYVTQDAHARLNKEITIQEYAEKTADLSKETVNNLLLTELEKYQLNYLDINRLCGTLSGGQSQILTIVVQLLKKPSLFIADQPFTALDKILKKKVWEELLKQRQSRQLTIVISSNELERMKKDAEQILLLQEGKIVEFSDKEAFFHQSKNPATLTFIQQNTIPPFVFP